MKHRTVALGLASVLALTASAAFAWGPGWGRGPGLAGINLSADQMAKIQKIQSDRYAEMAKVRSEMFAKQAELQALFREPTLDQTKIAAKGQEIEALQAQMQEKALAARTAVAEVVTPEQRAQIPGFGPGRGLGPGMGYGRGMGMGPRW
jgi:zinc resistance-associated protein